MANESEFIFSAKDEISPVIRGLINAVGDLDARTGGADKTIGRFEQSLATAATKAGMLNSEVQKSTAAIGQQAAQVSRAQRALDDLTAAGVRMTAAGVRGAGGRFVGNDVKQQYEEAARGVDALAKSQALMAETNRNLGMRAVQRDLAAMSVEMQGASAQAGKLANFLRDVPPNSMRYVLYDVSGSLAILGAAMAAGGVAAVKFAIDFERAFADVERTVQFDENNLANLEELRQTLISMSQEMPVAFAELAHIASLGGQLGIASEGIDEFTSVVAMLATTTDLSIDKAATALGRFKAILQVPEEQFDNLASSILQVGVNSVATESQIVNIATQISSMAQFAGFTAQQVVGLSAGLASIGAPPELSRGVVTRLFSEMSQAVADGGLTLDRFAELSGTSSEKFAKSWGTAGFQSVFLKFMQSIGKEGANAVSTLNELGITSVRDVPLIMRLAGAMSSTGEANGLLAESFAHAKKGWDENTKLAESYAVIADTVDSRIKALGNTFSAFFAALGGGALGPLGQVIDLLSGLMKGLTDVASHPVGGWILGVIATFITFNGILLLVGGGLTRLYAGLIGIQQAAAGVFGSMQKANTSLAATAVSARAAGGAMATTAVAARGLGSALAVALGPVGALVAILTLVPDAARAAGDPLKEMAGHGTDTAAALERLSNSKFDFGTTDLNLKDYERAPGLIRDIDRAMANMGGGTLAARDIKQIDDEIATLVNSGNLDAATSMVEEFAEKTGVSSKEALEFLTSTRSALDGQGASWEKSKSGADGFAYALDGVNGNLSETNLMMEESLKAAEKFQMGMAEAAQSFVDSGTLISEQQTARTEAAKAAAQAEAEANEEGATAAQDAWRKFYDGHSIDLEQYLVSLEAQNAAQDRWKENMERLADLGVSQEILSDLARLGPEGAPLVQALVDGSSEQLQRFKDEMGEAGDDAAMKFASRMLARETAVSGAMKTLSGKSKAGFLADMEEGRMEFTDILDKYSLDAAGNLIEIDGDPTGLYSTVDAAVLAIGRRRASMYVDVIMNAPAPVRMPAFPGDTFNGPGRAYGGYTGPGRKFEKAGIVHKGEFVFTKEATSRIGVKNLYAMMKGQRNARTMGYANGGLVGGGGMGIASLDAQSLSAILSLADRPIYLFTDDRVIADSASRGMTQLATRGTN